MKSISLRIVALIALMFSFVAWGQAGGGAGGGGGGAEQSVVVDTWGEVGDHVSGGADALGKVSEILKGILMDKKNAGTLVEKVSAALAKIPGMPSGRILQIKMMKALGNAVGVIDGVVTSVTSIFKATDAAFSGNREAYKKEVANYIMTMTAKIVGVAVGEAVTASLTAATVGVGALPAAGAGMLAGTAADATTKWLLKTFAKDAIENLVGKYYDWATGTGGNGPPAEGDDDPFNSNPENDGNGQMCPVPGNGNTSGGSSNGTVKPKPSPNTRVRRGGGGDTSARIW